MVCRPATTVLPLQQCASKLCHSGPPPSLDLLLERDPSAPACTLRPFTPHPQEALEAAEAAPVLLAVSHPPPDILPHPTGVTVADLNRPEHHLDPQAWRPDIHQAAMELPGLGNRGTPQHYWKHEVSQGLQSEGGMSTLGGPFALACGFGTFSLVHG